MWKIDKPNLTAGDTFDTCIAGLRDADLKNRMEAVRHHVVAAEAAFDAAANGRSLHTIAGAATIANTVNAKEMATLYDRHMARENSRGRSLYDELMIAAPDDRCPFCGHRTVSTLDHSLGKARHPALAVTPINLVPSCKDCNHTKGTDDPASQADQYLNAYYDDVTGLEWLYAEIIPGSPAGVRFYVQSPAAWDDTTSARVERHFRELKLASLYASQGGRQLRNIRQALQDFYDAGGKEAVREDLERSYRSCRQVELNTWLTALYKAAATNDWYCDGGFRA